MSRPYPGRRPPRQVTRVDPGRRSTGYRFSRESPEGSEAWPKPWVALRSASYYPFIYNRMVGAISPETRSGDLVHVFDKNGTRFGMGFFNSTSRIALRMLTFGETIADAAFFQGLLEAAALLREEIVRPGEATNTYRLVHGEGDGLSGLIVDRFDDVLSVEAFSLGAYRQLDAWLPALHSIVGTTKHCVRVDRVAASREGFPEEGAKFETSVPGLRSVRVRENSIRYAVDLVVGHKTGFFCDQRENRLVLAELSHDRSVLDVCCYTGGFALSALINGSARDITGVDLDEKAIDQAQHNANLNQVRGNWVHSDAFSYVRQMRENGKSWDVVVLDPPKFIFGRDSAEEGRKKYFDLNRLSVSIVKPSGWFATASCSGLLSGAEFEQLVVRAAHREGRRLQIIRTTGAGPDHPVSSNFPEGRYLSMLWCRVL